MRLFSCPACGHVLFFRNLVCACGRQIAFDPLQEGFVVDALFCTNRDAIGCNWVAAPSAPDETEPPASGLCSACAMTEVIPDLEIADNARLWADAEAAKRWTLVGLARWGWFSPGDPGPPPRFSLLAEETSAGPASVVMGHAEGLVTINVTEADPVELVGRQEALGERFRTMMGHFRHEIAHYLFVRLSEHEGFLDRFRRLFGDEREDYAAALQRHYAEGPADGWGGRHVTAYAGAHPHEDWAESAAHVMHLTDMLDSAVAGGLSGRGLPGSTYDAYAERDPARLVTRAARLGIVTNHVNRSMGLPDIYPFVLSATIRRKLAVVHRWLSRGPAR